MLAVVTAHGLARLVHADPVHRAADRRRCSAASAAWPARCGAAWSSSWCRPTSPTWPPATACPARSLPTSRSPPTASSSSSSCCVFPDGIQGGAPPPARVRPLAPPHRRADSTAPRQHAFTSCAAPAPAGRTPGRRHLMNRSLRVRLRGSSPPQPPPRWSPRAAARAVRARSVVVVRQRRPRPRPASPRPRSRSAATSRSPASAAPGYSEIAPGVQRLLPVRQRARRHLRPQDQVHLPRRRLRPVQDRRPSSTSSCCRTTSSRSSTAWARPPTWPWSSTSTPARCPDVFVASGCDCWNDPTSLPVHLRLAARLRPRGQDPRRLHQAALRGQEDRLLLPERRVRPGRRQGPGQRDPARRRW